MTLKAVAKPAARLLPEIAAFASSATTEMPISRHF
jgi:hypothetical protein